jgi:hypothetical protein
LSINLSEELFRLAFGSPTSVLFRVDVLKGKTEILEQSSLLEELAERCQQAGAMHWLEHFLNVPTFRGRTPYLLLGVDAESEGDLPDARNIRWALLMYEFSVLGIGLKAFSTDDISGFRTVIAPVGERKAAVTMAMNTLLSLGAQIAMISFAEAVNGQDFRLRTDAPCQWALRERPVANTLQAKDTYQATLMSVGKATRFNMRYYRRRLAKRLACELVSDANGLFNNEEIDAMNVASLNPFSRKLARLQFESSSRLQGGFLLLLRAIDGRWLGLIGGWRQAATTVLLWQMNRAGFERDSLGTVMRSYFVEHEVERGAERIVFYGGTPNSIQNSFVEGRVADLIVVRSSWQARLLRRVAAIFAKPHWWMKSTNFVARAVYSEPVVWRESDVRAKQLK